MTRSLLQFASGALAMALVLFPSVSVFWQSGSVEAGLVSLLDTEHILSFLLVVITFGFGRWFSKSGWPWYTAHLERRQRIDHELRQQQLVDDRQAQERLEELNRQMLKAFGDFREEVGGFRAVQEQIASVLLARGAADLIAMWREQHEREGQSRQSGYGSSDG